MDRTARNGATCWLDFFGQMADLLGRRRLLGKAVRMAHSCHSVSTKVEFTDPEVERTLHVSRLRGRAVRASQDSQESWDASYLGSHFIRYGRRQAICRRGRPPPMRELSTDRDLRPFAATPLAFAFPITDRRLRWQQQRWRRIRSGHTGRQFDVTVTATSGTITHTATLNIDCSVSIAARSIILMAGSKLVLQRI